MDQLKHILSQPPVPLLMGTNRDKVKDVRKLLQIWGVPAPKEANVQKLFVQLKEAMQDKTAAQRVVAGLSADERAALEAYFRYGSGPVSGSIMRMDLMARGLLSIREHGINPAFVYRKWENDPTQKLAARGCLLKPPGENREDQPWHYGYGRHETDRPLRTYAINPNLTRFLTPAGPAPWTMAAANGAVSLGNSRSTAEVALELSRVFAALASRPFWKTNQRGGLSQPALRALVKAAPLGEDLEFKQLDRQAFCFELLHQMGAVESGIENIKLNAAAARDIFSKPTLEQARLWIVAWLKTEYWHDMYGAQPARTTNSAVDMSVAELRKVLAWALSSVAHLGDQWVDLKAFMSKIWADSGTAGRVWYGRLASQDHWDPQFVDRRNHTWVSQEDQDRVNWLTSEGTILANALMVTLASLGLIERGREEGAELRYCFRLTPIGRALFGAPELGWESQPTHKFLVVQPNFDVVAFLDQTDAHGIGSLGLVLENLKPTLGPVQTFHLTHQSYYRALELGLSHQQAVDLLQQSSQHALPANVLQTLNDWARQRDSLAVHSNVTLVGFADPEERDSFLATGVGRSCGDRWVILEPGQNPPAPAIEKAITVAHSGHRPNLTADELGLLSHRKPLDSVQRARLRLFAEQDGKDWRITSASVKGAIKRGLQQGVLRGWLHLMLAEPAPALLNHAIEAWMGKPAGVNLGDVRVLHVADRAQFETIARSELLKPLLLGTLGSGYFMVRPEGVKELARLLGEYGFEVTMGITPESR